MIVTPGAVPSLMTAQHPQFANDHHMHGHRCALPDVHHAHSPQPHTNGTTTRITHPLGLATGVGT